MVDEKSGIALRVRRIAKKTLKIVGIAFAAYIVVVALAVWIAGDGDYDSRLHETIVNDITQLNPVPMARVVTPHSVDDIAAALQGSSGPVSIGGGRFSMGGQTAIDNGLQLDMREFDDVVAFDAGQREIVVQAGITWREVQEYIDTHDLSVRIMQTYANFTVGGSLSVNVHGRYIGHGPIISSVKAIQLVLADGSVTSSKLANGAVTAAKVATGAVVSTLSGLTDDVRLVGGDDIIITPSADEGTITISTEDNGFPSSRRWKTNVTSCATRSPAATSKWR